MRRHRSPGRRSRGMVLFVALVAAIVAIVVLGKFLRALLRRASGFLRSADSTP